MSEKYIWVTNQFEGFHAWEGAPNEVDFLRNRHRHIFHTKIYISVDHNDRDIEFIIFKRFINNSINEIGNDVGSCETIADVLYDKIRVSYPDRSIRIEVSEDGENGCFCQY